MTCRDMTTDEDDELTEMNVTAVAKAIHQSRLDEGEAGPSWEELGECTQCMAHARAALKAHYVAMRKYLMKIMGEEEIH